MCPTSPVKTSALTPKDPCNFMKQSVKGSCFLQWALALRIWQKIQYQILDVFDQETSPTTVLQVLLFCQRDPLSLAHHAKVLRIWRPNPVILSFQRQITRSKWRNWDMRDISPMYWISWRSWNAISQFRKFISWKVEPWPSIGSNSEACCTMQDKWDETRISICCPVPTSDQRSHDGIVGPSTACSATWHLPASAKSWISSSHIKSSISINVFNCFHEAP